ncbi:hypothetical protein [Methanobrevibacter sp.]|uniref:hypothetical protein n=1 Tax=Methanobrevibacter sp. TaxID=66852 RepID=UPI002608BC12|nr:hypothetical protein [uncultured Methanobrevibacter sp.]
MFSSIVLRRKFNKAREFREFGVYDEALRIYNELIEKGYDLLNTYFNIGVVFSDKKRF